MAMNSKRLNGVMTAIVAAFSSQAHQFGGVTSCFHYFSFAGQLLYITLCSKKFFVEVGTSPG